MQNPQYEYILHTVVHILRTTEVIKLRYPNIAAERARTGMTQESLAQALNVTRKTIYNWETKGFPPNAICKMADLFGVSEEYLRVVEE